MASIDCAALDEYSLNVGSIGGMAGERPDEVFSAYLDVSEGEIHHLTTIDPTEQSHVVTGFLLDNKTRKDASTAVQRARKWCRSCAQRGKGDRIRQIQALSQREMAVWRARERSQVRDGANGVGIFECACSSAKRDRARLTAHILHTDIEQRVVRESLGARQNAASGGAPDPLPTLLGLQSLGPRLFAADLAHCAVLTMVGVDARAPGTPHTV